MSRFDIVPLPLNQQIVLPKKSEKFIPTKICVNRVNSRTKHKIQLFPPKRGCNRRSRKTISSIKLSENNALHLHLATYNTPPDYIENNRTYRLPFAFGHRTSGNNPRPKFFFTSV